MGRAKEYLTMGLDCHIGWPSQERTVCFQGHEITLRPEKDTESASVVVQLNKDLTRTDARRLVKEFLSGLAWVRRGRLAETFCTFCTGAPLRIGKGPCGMVDDSSIEYIPDPGRPKAKLALALYREALSVNMVPYQFLGFFKILNVLHGTGREQKSWINDNVDAISERQAATRLAELRQDHDDVGAYLYESGRCAVAHAFHESVVNPDEPQHIWRLSSDLPLVKALAERAIERELGVKSQRAVRKAHLYELEGFRTLFGQELVAGLRAGESVEPGCLPLPSRLSLRLRGHDQLPSFDQMKAVVPNLAKGMVQIHLSSVDERVQARVLLDFTNERLLFDALNWLEVSDDGSPEAVRSCIDELLFCKHWMANGVTELWDSTSGTRLGRSQPVCLVNTRPDWDAMDRELAKLQERLDKETGSEDGAPGRGD